MHQKRCHTSNTCEQVHPSHTNVTEVLLSALLSALQGPKMCTCIQKNCIRNSIWFRANRLHLKKHFNWFVPTAMFSDSTNPHGPCNSCDPPQLLLHLCIIHTATFTTHVNKRIVHHPHCHIFHTCEQAHCASSTLPHLQCM
jgi:hypothetical protein